jgi:hypothetical protein
MVAAPETPFSPNLTLTPEWPQQIFSIAPDMRTIRVVAILSPGFRSSQPRSEGNSKAVLTMKRITTWTKAKRILACTSIAVASAAVTGCQVDVAGQTLPSPWYLYDDIQYFAPGPEFKLQNEAEAMKAEKARRVLGE